MSNKLSTVRRFTRYVLPSVAGMLVTSLYVVVDGVFVGRGVGAHGIAAINLVWPYIATYIAVSLMTAVGGAALMSHAMGAGNNMQGQRYFSQSLWLLGGFGLLFMVCAVGFPEFFCRLLGADSGIMADCIAYLRYYMLFAVPYGFSIGLAVFVRNDHNPNLAFVGMVFGAIVNVILDYVAIFVLDWGMEGAALASGIGQSLTSVVLLLHFVRRHGSLRLVLERPELSLLRQIVTTGSPELMINLSSPVSMLAYNYALMSMMGADGVAVFGIIAYIVSILGSLFTGVSQGIQPILCYSAGAGDHQSLRRFFGLGLAVNLSLSVVIVVLLRLFDRAVVGIFTTDPTIAALTVAAFSIYAVSCLFGSVNVVCITYLLSTRHTQLANLLSLARGILFVLLFVTVLPMLLGTDGIWWANVAAEGATFVVAVVSLWRLRRLGLT